jgi:ssDNA thymidine ADP-ribosyltransferase, DarT
MSNLTPEKALIFRIVHRCNIPWILGNGLHCRNSDAFDPNYVDIGNAELIDKRNGHPVPCPPGGTLSDYVPFYFTPFSPMLYNIKTGWGGLPKRKNDEIVILISSLKVLKDRGIKFIFTDRHAYLRAARFFSDMSDLSAVDWDILQRRDFKQDPEDPGKFERYQAEALVHKALPCDGLLGIACYDDATVGAMRRLVEERGLELRIVARRGWYF